MGLDNGIMLKIKDNKLNLPEKLKAAFESYSEGSYDVLYWRKCWNVRGAILDVLAENQCFEDENDYKYHISLEVFEKILDHLREQVYRGLTWKNSGESIWEWDSSYKWADDTCEWEYDDVGICDKYWSDLTYAFELLWFLKTIDDKESYELEFYDSY